MFDFGFLNLKNSVRAKVIKSKLLSEPLIGVDCVDFCLNHDLGGFLGFIGFFFCLNHDLWD